ncbi:hypothetical protein [uncultured Tateyamaria sp.]|uniref:hypothetical protein n=1 Tax=uncultured Tateyamaria sp. TaxID=455651 RepID=UPI002614D1E9|nr:hypothetical protein [uncultured Tateyamaria sp.]
MTQVANIPVLNNGHRLSVPNGAAIPCPNCGAEARFLAADVRRPLKRAIAQGWTPGKNEGLFNFARTGRVDVSRHRPHTFQYRGLGHRQVSEDYDIWGPCLDGAINIGTSVCSTCHTPQKIEINWPDDAHYQLSFLGKRLWFEDRDHVIGYLTLLSRPQTRLPRYQYWFDRVLPTVFKTARARKTLVPKVKKMLRT